MPLCMRNKKKGLILSLFVLFILWGLQYKIVNDWDANLSRWLAVNGRFFLSRDIEYIYIIILKVCKPLSFYGFLMLSAYIELKTIYIFTKRFVIPKFYWITIFILMLRINLGLLMINSNRQSLALLATMLASLFLIKNTTNKKQKLFNYLAAFISILIAVNIHKGAILSFLLLLFPALIYFINKLDKYTILILFSIPFFAKFFLNLTEYINLFSDFIQGSSFSEGFEQYSTEFNSNAGYSFFEQFFNYIIIVSISLLFHHLNKAEKFFAFSFVFATIAQGYLTDTLLRTMQYFQIYTIFIIPNLVYYINYAFRVSNNKSYITPLNYNIKLNTQKYIPFIKTIYCALILFCIFSLIRNIYFVDYDTWQGWKNFKTIFESPNWI